MQAEQPPLYRNTKLHSSCSNFPGKILRLSPCTKPELSLAAKRKCYLSCHDGCGDEARNNRIQATFFALETAAHSIASCGKNVSPLRHSCAITDVAVNDNNVGNDAGDVAAAAGVHTNVVNETCNTVPVQPTKFIDLQRPKNVKNARSEAIVIFRADDTVCDINAEHRRTRSLGSPEVVSPPVSQYLNNSIASNDFLPSNHNRRDGDALIPIPQAVSDVDRLGFANDDGQEPTTLASAAAIEVNFLHRDLPKTLLAIVFLLIGWSASILALAFTHDRIPIIEPLPDIVFAFIPIQPWALKYSEFTIILGLMIVVVMVVTHKYRRIVFRRICIIVGLLYLGRSVTMLVTGLPPPDINYPCEEQVRKSEACLPTKLMLVIF